jgi:hypothetical protein
MAFFEAIRGLSYSSDSAMDEKMNEKNLGPRPGVFLEPFAEEEPSKTLDYPLSKKKVVSNSCGGAVDGDGTDRVAYVSSCDAAN